MTSGRKAQIGVVIVYPDLLGTYGDGGNGSVLARRLESLGYLPKVIKVNSDESLPNDADFYLMGGGEDGPQSLAARRLIKDGGLERAKSRGAVVVGICAGFQVLSQEFVGSKGLPVEGLGIISARTFAMEGPRAVGELLSVPLIPCQQPFLSGYENHRSGTELLGNAKPLGEVRSGVGNLRGSNLDGAYEGNVLCSYMHGPAFARNPGLVDFVVSRRIGPLPEVEEDPLRLVQQRLLAERVEAVLAEEHTRSSRQRGPRRLVALAERARISLLGP